MNLQVAIQSRRSVTCHFVFSSFVSKRHKFVELSLKFASQCYFIWTAIPLTTHATFVVSNKSMISQLMLMSQSTTSLVHYHWMRYRWIIFNCFAVILFVVDSMTPQVCSNKSYLTISWRQNNQYNNRDGTLWCNQIDCMFKFTAGKRFTFVCLDYYAVLFQPRPATYINK